MSKIERQSRILKMISERSVETQEELVLALKVTGMEITQATISRDIKELGIIKVTGSSGRQHYAHYDRIPDIGISKLMKIFSASVRKICSAGNLVILKTLPGMASGAATTIDALEMPELIGTLAGDDTIFLACATAEGAARVVSVLETNLYDPEQSF